MNNKVYVAIMAGGVGSRFWPYSRNNNPKQFLDVLGIGKTLLQLTYHRFKDICPPENIYIVSNSDYNNLIKEQLPELNDEQVLLEPNRRNTAPCIAYAAYKIHKKDPEACLVVTPADHTILMEDLFTEAINTGIEVALESDKLITLGIQPNRPETGYGYIQFHAEQKEPVKKVKTFTEKPDLELAEKFVESGEFVWNSGIFIWRTDTIIKAFEKYLPEIADTFNDITPYYYTKEEDQRIEDAYAITKGISIDYGIMEKADNVYVVLGKFGWSDLGSWNAMHEIRDKDPDLNVIDGNIMLYDAKNCIIKGDNKRLIVVQGLDGYLVADCDDVLLICRKDEEKLFRSFVTDVRNRKGEKYI